MRKEGEPHTVPLSGLDVTYRIRRRRNQKHINLRVSLEGEIIVSAPFGVSVTKIQESLKTKEPWLSRHLKKAAESRDVNDPLKQILLHGREYAVEVVRDPRHKRVVRLDETARTVTVRTSMQGRARIVSVLAGYLQREAKRHFPVRVRELSRTTGIPYQRLFIRNQRSRWGSSSGRGNLSVNWRAVMAPAEVQDYLIVHELSHQVHLNHSKAFWRVVEKWCPDFKAANRWLRNHSAIISLFR